jgi:deazaflavin-dependent oxidoreductase (nitroreductase family)
MSGEMFNSNDEVIEQFRQNGGKVGGFYEGAPLLLLTTTGRKSGQRRTTPLAYRTDGDRLIVVAANVGASRSPDWYHNLVAQPAVTVEVGAETVPATASLVEGELRERILAQGQADWAAARERYPDLPEMPADEAKTYPVIALTLRRDRSRRSTHAGQASAEASAGAATPRDRYRADKSR